MTREFTVRTYDIITFFSIKINRTVPYDQKQNLSCGIKMSVGTYVHTYVLKIIYLYTYVRHSFKIFFSKNKIVRTVRYPIRNKV